MRDCVVLGCGRSGTSLAAGLLAGAGYDCGAELLPPDPGGPTGFFEARRVNEVNERLLAPYDAAFASRDGYSRPLRDGERWLAVLPPEVEVEAPGDLLDAMRRAIPASPFCCKDPRFGYTLASWRPLFAGAVFACVFRHPAETAASIAGQVRYGDLTVAPETALEIWKAIYSHVLGRHRHDGEWVFVHYEQLLDGSGVERLGLALGAPLDPSFADPTLRRASANGPAPGATAPIYERLCAAAGYAP